MAKNVLKEAIADAKAVREVALANAKAALEEAFTPKLQSMLSAKLSEELDEDMYDEDEDIDMDEMLDLDDMDEDVTMNTEMDMDMDEDMYDENMDEGEEDSMDEEINLEDILNELELDEDDSEEDSEEETLDETPLPNYNYSLNEDFDLDALLNEINDLDDEELTEYDSEDDLEEVIENKGCGCKQENETISQLSTKLNESSKSFNVIKNELNEVNLLNSKLLYVNRIFKANNLNEGQKLRVVETLDNAESVKEAKLIYETIKDTFTISKENKTNSKKQRPIRESFGMASKAAGLSTAPKRPILNESNDMVTRMQKLANIKIN